MELLSVTRGSKEAQEKARIVVFFVPWNVIFTVLANVIAIGTENNGRLL